MGSTYRLAPLARRKLASGIGLPAGISNRLEVAKTMAYSNWDSALFFLKIKVRFLQALKN